MGVIKHTVWIAAISSLACDSPRTLFVQTPPLGDARSIIASIATANSRHLAAQSRGDGEGVAILLPLEQLGTATISVLAYDEPIEALVAAEGLLPIAARGEEGYALPVPDATHFARVLGGKVGAWDDGTAHDDALFELRIAGRRPIVDPCARPVMQVFTLEARADPKFFVALAPDAALLGMEDATFYRVTAEGATRLESLSAELPHRAAFARSANEVWLAGARGALFAGDPASGRFEAKAPSPLGLTLTRIAASPASELFELYALSAEGSFERFDGMGWTALRPGGASKDDWRRDVERVGANEAIAVGLAESVAHRYLRGVVEEERLGSSVEAISIASVSGFGAVIGTFDGRLLVFGEGEWRELGGSPISLPITAIAAFNGGLLAGGGAGLAVEYHDGFGYCEPMQTSHAIIKHMVAIGGGLAIAGDRAAGTTSAAVVTFVRP